jgi:hypothetical protein
MAQMMAETPERQRLQNRRTRSANIGGERGRRWLLMIPCLWFASVWGCQDLDADSTVDPVEPWHAELAQCDEGNGPHGEVHGGPVDGKVPTAVSAKSIGFVPHVPFPAGSRVTVTATWNGVDGSHHSPEWSRYAVDMVGGGGEVVAVADGEVVFVHRDCPNTPDTCSSCPTISGHGSLGNSVVIRHATGVYSRYGHLFPGSIPDHVTVGSRACTGLVLGRYGESGCTFGAHIHFQFQNAVGTNNNGTLRYDRFEEGGGPPRRGDVYASRNERRTSCGPVCTDTCSAGERRCSDGTSWEVCADHNGDGCTEWGARAACAAGQECQAAECVDLFRAAVGADCGTSGECGWDRVCEFVSAGGFCTRDCEGDLGCPDGSLCAAIGGRALCAPAVVDDAGQCREGLVRRQPTEGESWCEPDCRLADLCVGGQVCGDDGVCSRCECAADQCGVQACGRDCGGCSAGEECGGDGYCRRRQTGADAGTAPADASLDMSDAADAPDGRDRTMDARGSGVTAVGGAETGAAQGDEDGGASVELTSRTGCAAVGSSADRSRTGDWFWPLLLAILSRKVRRR